MDNLRGSLFMVLAMLAFAIEDMLIKMMADALPVGQIISMIGGGGAVLFGLWTGLREGPGLFSDFLQPKLLLRNGCDAVGTIGFATAIVLTPLSTASAILQATPLFVAMGAALFLGQSVGWRRWLAILFGLGGVLLILRPGTEVFDPNALFAVLAVIGLGSRDLVTRTLPRSTSTGRISTYAFIVLVPTGAVLMLLQGQSVAAVSPTDTGRLIAAVGIGIFAYGAIVTATRIGDLAVVSPFRYTRLVFALIIGVLAFGESPDAMTLLGAAVIIASGLYTLWRETRLTRLKPAL